MSWNAEKQYRSYYVHPGPYQCVEAYKEAVSWTEKAITELNGPCPDYLLTQFFTDKATSTTRVRPLFFYLRVPKLENVFVYQNFAFFWKLRVFFGVKHCVGSRQLRNNLKFKLCVIVLWRL